MHCKLIALLFLSAAPAFGQAPPPLLLFGDSEHKTLLGCINCTKTYSGAVCNKYGAYGSRYNSDSIWNPYGSFGSKHSSDSPWNRYASDPPLIVDESGNSYGRLTANKYAFERTKIKVLNDLTDLVAAGTPLDAARGIYCGE